MRALADQIEAATATGGTDPRKGCTGLFALVRGLWELDALAGVLYVSCNRPSGDTPRLVEHLLLK